MMRVCVCELMSATKETWHLRKKRLISSVNVSRAHGCLYKCVFHRNSSQVNNLPVAKVTKGFLHKCLFMSKRTHLMTPLLPAPDSILNSAVMRKTPKHVRKSGLDHQYFLKPDIIWLCLKIKCMIVYDCESGPQSPWRMWWAHWTRSLKNLHLSSPLVSKLRVSTPACFCCFPAWHPCCWDFGPFHESVELVLRVFQNRVITVDKNSLKLNDV